MSYANYDPNAKSSVKDNEGVEYPQLPEGYRWNVKKESIWSDWAMIISIQKRERVGSAFFPKTEWKTIVKNEVLRLSTNEQGMIVESGNRRIPTESELRSLIQVAIATIMDQFESAITFEDKLGAFLNSVERFGG